MKNKYTKVVASCLLMCLSGILQAGVTFYVPFDSDVTATIAGGDPNGYKYSEDGIDPNLPATRGITTDAAQFGDASLDCITTGKLLAYRTPGNIDLSSQGTLEFFVNLPKIDASATHYIANVGRTNGLEFLVVQAAAWAKPHLYAYWGGVALGTAGGYIGDLTADVFNHVAVTWEMSGGAGTGVVKIFINDVLLLTATGLNPANPACGTMWFGSHYNTGGAGPSYMDDIAIYDDIRYKVDKAWSSTCKLRNVPIGSNLLFAASFDKDVNADIRTGNGTGYKYYENYTYYGQVSNRTITTAAAQFGAASLNCVPSAQFLAYRTPGNLDLVKGTLEFFVNVPKLNTTSTHYVVSVGTGSTVALGALEFRIGQAAAWGAPHLLAYWNGVSLAATLGDLTPNVFNHVAITWDSSGGPGTGIAKVYLNGILRKTATGLNPLSPVYETMYFGSHYNTGNAGPTYMDDIAIYKDVIYTGDSFKVRTWSARPPETCNEVLVWGFGLPSDLYADCKVDLADFAKFAMDWSKSNDPNNPTDPGYTENW